MVACDEEARPRHPSDPPVPGPYFQDIPFHSQFDGNDDIAHRICGPTSLAMHLAADGVEVSPSAIAREAYDCAHDIYGNWSRLCAVAGVHGHLSWARRFATLAGLEAELLAGYRAIVSVSYEKGELDGAPLDRTGGHLIVLRGWDAEGNPVCNDPAFRDRSGDGVVYDRRQFEHVWTAHGGTALVMRPR